MLITYADVKCNMVHNKAICILKSQSEKNGKHHKKLPVPRATVEWMLMAAGTRRQQCLADPEDRLVQPSQYRTRKRSASHLGCSSNLLVWADATLTVQDPGCLTWSQMHHRETKYAT